MANKKANGSSSTKGTDLTALFEKHAGEGHGQVGAEDLITPRIQIIQALSPVLQKSKPEYHADASAGDFLFTGNSSIIDGEEGFLFQPCWYDRNYVEWNLRESGGGLVAVHPADTDLIYKAERDAQYRDIVTHNDGRRTQLVNTGNHYGFLHADDTTYRCVINLSGSQLKHSRAWNNMVVTQVAKGKKGTFNPPAFAQLYRVCTKEESNDKGSWYGFNVAMETFVSDKEQFSSGQDFANFCEEGGMAALSKPSTNKKAIENQSEDKEDWV